jgi:CrcB protein
VLPPNPEAFPWATLMVNVVGAVALGTIASVPSSALPHHEVLRPALGTGVCGGLTTFSTLALEVFQRLPDRPLLAAGYSATSVALAPLSAFLGVRAVSSRLEKHQIQQEGGNA